MGAAASAWPPLACNFVFRRGDAFHIYFLIFPPQPKMWSYLPPILPLSTPSPPPTPQLLQYLSWLELRGSNWNPITNWPHNKAECTVKLN